MLLNATLVAGQLAKINFSFRGNFNDNTLKITDKILLFLFLF